MQSINARESRTGRMLRPWRILAIVATAALAAALPVLGKESSRLALRTESTLSINGTSTVHAWHAKASTFQVSFAVDPARWPADATDLPAIEKAIAAGVVDSVAISVDVKSMHSGKDGLDKNMYKALKAEQHPKILCWITGYETKTAANGALSIVARGRLKVAGVEKQIEIPAATTREGDALRMKGSVVVKMTDFGIKPPVMMMGTIKTGNEVTVGFDLFVAPGNGSQL